MGALLSHEECDESLDEDFQFFCPINIMFMFMFMLCCDMSMNMNTCTFTCTCTCCARGRRAAAGDARGGERRARPKGGQPAQPAEIKLGGR